MRRVNTKRAVAVLLLGAAIAVVAAGCGGGSKKTTTSDTAFTPYETSMQKLGASLYSTLVNFGTANRTATGPAIVIRNLRGEQVQLRAAAAKLAKITPPDKVKAEHAQLISGVRKLANELDGVIAAVTKCKCPGPIGRIQRLPGTLQMGKATTEITNKGYVIAVS
jgi:hypothetical protein